MNNCSLPLVKKTRKILGMHPAALNISYKTYNPLADTIIIIIIINYYRLTRIIILPMVVTIFAF